MTDSALAHDCGTMRGALVADIRNRLLSPSGSLDLGALFKVFSDPTRLRILGALAASELCVCELAAVLEMSQSAISHQLALLKRARLVRYRKDGKTVLYALDDDHVRRILAVASEHLSEKEASRGTAL